MPGTNRHSKISLGTNLLQREQCKSHTALLCLTLRRGSITVRTCVSQSSLLTWKGPNTCTGSCLEALTGALSGAGLFFEGEIGAAAGLAEAPPRAFVGDFARTRGALAAAGVSTTTFFSSSSTTIGSASSFCLCSALFAFSSIDTAWDVLLMAPVIGTGGLCGA